MSNKRTNAYFAGACARELAQGEAALKSNPHRLRPVMTLPPRSFRSFMKDTIFQIARSLGIPRMLLNPDTRYSTRSAG